MSGLFLLASVCGSFIGSMLLSNHVYLLNALSLLTFVITAAIAAFVPGHLGRGSQDIARLEDSSTGLLVDQETDSAPASPRSSKVHRTSHKVRLFDKLLSYRVTLISYQLSISHIVLQSWRSSLHALLTLFRLPNPTFTVVIIFLINGLATRAEVLLSQYTSLVLHWPLATVNKVLALKALVSALWLFALPTLRKRYLEPRMSTAHIDLWITQVSLITNIVGMIGLGFAAPAPLFILALCIYTSGMGLADSLTALGTITLPPGEEVSAFYVRTGLIQTIAGLIGAPLWSTVFSITLRSGFLPLGVPFWLCAGLFAAGVGCTSVLKNWLNYYALPQA